MKILQKITIKQVLTEESKRTLINKYEGRKHQLQKECDQLRFELKKLEKSKKFSSQRLKDNFEKEMSMRQEKIKLVDFQLEQLHILPLESELKEKEVQGIVDIKIGDNWDEQILDKTIVVKNGIVTEIR
ncbi:YlqD family protein [Rossellomorea sp. BNER]|uniref:YlqD family protein n=1 Tax=Rossellomorea sp. BNER TaxID=2962031 RepID=UPI003AF2335F|nr:YlqD family protein [Rossellomorea sp. BNER]